VESAAETAVTSVKSVDAANIELFKSYAKELVKEMGEENALGMFTIFC
tara:strand:+ start:631 stop:774 length:144 start_codon:yes stop_codon:yes gene_type:complete